MLNTIKAIVATLKEVNKEMGRANLHWYLAGKGVLDRPNGDIARCNYQKAIDEAVELGLISRRKTPKGKVFLKAI